MLCASATAFAQTPADARQSYEEGVRAFERSQFRPALEAFERAFATAGDPALLFNIAVAHERLGEPGEAATALRRYLLAVPNAPNRAEIEARIERLRGVAAELHPVSSSAATAPASTAPVASGAQSPVGDASDATSRSTPIAPVVVAGVGVLGLAASAVFFALRESALSGCVRESARYACSTHEAYASAESAAGWNLATNVALVGGGVLVAVGAVWLVFARPRVHTESRPSTALRLIPGPGDLGVGVAGSF